MHLPWLTTQTCHKLPIKRWQQQNAEAKRNHTLVYTIYIHIIQYSVICMSAACVNGRHTPFLGAVPVPKVGLNNLCINFPCPLTRIWKFNYAHFVYIFTAASQVKWTMDSCHLPLLLSPPFPPRTATAGPETSIMHAPTPSSTSPPHRPIPIPPPK